MSLVDLFGLLLCGFAVHRWQGVRMLGTAHVASCARCPAMSVIR